MSIITTNVVLLKSIKNVGEVGQQVRVPARDVEKLFRTGKARELCAGDFASNQEMTVAEIRAKLGQQPLTNSPAPVDPKAPLPMEYAEEPETVTA